MWSIKDYAAELSVWERNRRPTVVNSDSDSDGDQHVHLSSGARDSVF